MKKKRFILWIVCWITIGITACGKQENPNTDVVQGTQNISPIQMISLQDRIEQKRKENTEILVLKIGEKEISMDTMMFFIYSMEAKGAYNEAYYQEYYGTSFWNLEYNRDYTMRDVYKDLTMDSVIQYTILADQAKKHGISLTKEEEQENKIYVEQVLNTMSTEQLEYAGFTVESLTQVNAMVMLAEKYYEEMIEQIEISEEDIQAQISLEDYKEYETEYWFLSTSVYNENYEVIQVSDKEKEAVLEQMQQIRERLLDGEETEVLQMEYAELLNQTRIFLEQGIEAEEEYKKTASKLKIGEYSKPVQTEYGVYIIRMINDACTYSYEKAMETAYEEARQSVFEEQYEALEESYKITIQKEFWDSLEFGTIAYVE